MFDWSVLDPHRSTNTSSPSTSILISLLSAAEAIPRLLPKRQAVPVTHRPLLLALLLLVLLIPLPPLLLGVPLVLPRPPHGAVDIFA